MQVVPIMAEGGCQTMRLVAFLSMTLSCLLSPAWPAQTPAGSTDRDRYGGWDRVRFEATGFFRVAEREGI